MPISIYLFLVYLVIKSCKLLISILIYKVVCPVVRIVKNAMSIYITHLNKLCLSSY